MAESGRVHQRGKLTIVERASRNKPIVFLSLGLILIASYGVLLIWYSTRWGPYAGSDSVEYLEAARNAARGLGLVLVRASSAIRPMTLRPPLYSIALSLGLSSGLSGFDSARVLDLMLYPTLVFVVWFSTYRISQSALVALGITVLIGLSSSVISIYSGMLAEPLYLVLTFASLFCMIGYLQGRDEWLISAAGLFTGLAWLTRFTGVVGISLGILIILLQRGISITRRVVHVLLFILPALLPTVWWKVSILQYGPSGVVYDLNFTALWDRLRDVRGAYVNTLWNWSCLSLLPGITKYRTKLYTLMFILLLIIGIAIVIYRYSRKHIPTPRIAGWLKSFFLVMTSFCGFYLAFITVAYVFVQFPKPDLDSRILLPAYLCFLSSAISGICLACQVFSWEAATRVAMFGLPVLIGLSQVSASISEARDLHENGLGYASPRWRSSELIAKIAQLPVGTTVISTDIDAIMLFLDKPAYHIPELERGVPIIPYTNFIEGLDHPLRNEFTHECAVLAFFDEGYWKFYELYAKAAADRIEILTEGLGYIQTEDGALYFNRECQDQLGF